MRDVEPYTVIATSPGRAVATRAGTDTPSD
jgi:hypothetical protein